MNELDEILLEQLHTARYIAKKMRKARRVMGLDYTLLSLQAINEKKIQFYETMINDKTLLQKKRKKKKVSKDPDILARSTPYEWYRNFMIVSNIGYKMMIESVQAYMSLFKKGKE
mgnify:FL=1